MLPTSQPESRPVHRLARFVTVEAICMHLNLLPEQIRRIDCWRYVIHVVAQGISTFVSYADLPPIVAVEAPKEADFACWHKRCQVRKQKHAPAFWAQFYAQQLGKSRCEDELYSWGSLMRLIKSLLPEAAFEWLRGVYRNEHDALFLKC